MKIFFTLISLLSFTFSFSQWTRVEQLPSSDIFNLFHKGNTLYAGGKKIVYISSDKGLTWDSTTAIPQLSRVDNIIVFKNELYASGFGQGVFKSPDGGITWQNITTGIPPFISDFTEWKDDLYAATEANSIYKLDRVNPNRWAPFSNGLSDFSINTTTIAGNSNTLIAGTLGNGIYDYLAPNSQTWQERLLSGQLDPNEGMDDIGTAHDTLFIAGRSGRFYLSTDNGFTWSKFGNVMSLTSNSTVNARQAFLTARNFVAPGQGIETIFFYQKKDSLTKSVVPFSLIQNHFTYRLEIIDNKIWDASIHGLFYMPLSDLPGITEANDSETLLPLPLTYISFDVQLNTNNTVSVEWKTADEFNIDHFEVERSVNGLTWIALANVGPNPLNQYQYTDASPQTGDNYYRVKAVGNDGKLFYTNIKSVRIGVEAKFRAWPNPAADRINISIINGNESLVYIKIFDSKGALVKMQSATILPGSNHIEVNTGSLASGLYTLSAEWNNGQIKQTTQVLKQ